MSPKLFQLWNDQSNSDQLSWSKSTSSNNINQPTAFLQTLKTPFELPSSGNAPQFP